MTSDGFGLVAQQTGSDTAARLEIPERRQHPAYLAIAVGQILRAGLPAIVVGAIQAPSWFWPALVGVPAAGALLMWWTRTYSVSRGEFRLRTGVLSRTITTVPLRRIAAVDAERGVVQRILGIWALKIQTPGDGARATATVHGLSQRHLDDLLAALRPVDGTTLNADGPAGYGDPPWPDGTTVRGAVVAVLGTRELIVAAVTGWSLPLLLAGFGALANSAQDLLPDSWRRRVGETLLSAGPGAVLIAIGLLLLVGVLVGIVVTALRMARFTLIRDDDRVRWSRGLLSQRSSSVPVDRIQAVRVVEGQVRRLLGYCSLEVEVAGVGARDEIGRTLFPLIRRDRAADLLARALPELAWLDEPLPMLPPRVRRRYRTLPLIVGGAAGAALLFAPGWWRLAAVLPPLFAALVGVGRGRDAGWSLNERTVVLRWRSVLSRSTVVARTRRVQLTQLTRTLPQRRSDLAGIRLRLASHRTAGLRHLDRADADHLLHTVGRRPHALASLRTP